jgi:hypothetical protein
VSEAAFQKLKALQAKLQKAASGRRVTVSDALEAALSKEKT